MPLFDESITVTDTQGITVEVSGGVAVPISQSAILIAGVNSNNTSSFLQLDQQNRLSVTSFINGGTILVAGVNQSGSSQFLSLDNSGSLYTTNEEEKTFVITANNISLSLSKSLISIFNSGSNSNSIIKIREIWLKNVQTTNIAGIVTTFELFRFTGLSSTGSQITIQSYDTLDLIPTNITASTSASLTGQSPVSMFRYVWSANDWTANEASHTETEEHPFQMMFPIWRRHDIKEKAISLRGNQGLSVNLTTNTTVGLWDANVVFSI